jgi:voltage-gated potassium channel Kch
VAEAGLDGLRAGLDRLTGESADVHQERPLLRRFLTELTLFRAILGIMLVAVTFTVLAALLMRIVEPDQFPDFASAIWWSAQTVSTVGYGDDVPTSGAGRLVAVVVMLFGIALVPAITSLVVAVFLNQQLARMRSED